MAKNIRTQVNKVIGKSLNAYHEIMKPVVDDLKFKEQYQGRIVDCMVGEIDDNYIETPETDSPIVKLEYSKEGVVKIPTIKGKTILVDSDGNATDTPGEGCRLVSVGEEESNKMIILSKNKNLFDGELEFGYLNIENGEIVNGTHNIRCKNFIKLNKNTQYDISKNIQGDLWVLTYDKNKNFICNNYNTIKPMDDMFFVKFYIVNSSSVDLKIANIQIEESSVATTYVEPKHYKTEILLNEPLRSIPNGVYDEIVGNKIIRRIGALTLNGTEKSWENWDEKSFVLRENYFGDAKECTTYLEKRGYSNSFTWGNADTPKTFRYYKQSTVLWSMFGKDDNSQTLDEFKKKLKENPTEVIYELAEPIMEELPNSITTQGFDDTTMYIENSITPTVSYGYNALIPYKEELSNQKEEVEVNTLDIENNIIPYLMDMEFNLIMMEDEE